MRICLISPVGVIGGAERVLLAAVRGVKEHVPAVEVSVVLLADGPLRLACEHLGVTVTVVPLPTSLAGQGDAQLVGLGRTRALIDLGWSICRQGAASVMFLVRFRSIIRRLNPELIHTHGAKAHLLVALVRPRGTPVLWHLHDFLTGRKTLVRLLQWAVWSCGDAVSGLAVSDAVRSDARASLPNLPVITIRNSVATTHFAPGPGDGAELDRLAGMPLALAGTIRIGMVATYARWKGQDVFLEALARLGDGLPPIRGYVVGGPIYTTSGSQFTETTLRALASELSVAERVGFIPHQSDPAPIYRSLDLVIHASTQPEPFGLTIAEAMACGRPVVVAAAGGAVELFTPDHDALGCVPGMVEELAQAIRRLVADPDLRHQLGINARRTAVEHFAPDRFARALAEAYAARTSSARHPR